MDLFKSFLVDQFIQCICLVDLIIFQYGFIYINLIHAHAHSQILMKKYLVYELIHTYLNIAYFIKKKN